MFRCGLALVFLTLGVVVGCVKKSAPVNEVKATRMPMEKQYVDAYVNPFGIKDYVDACVAALGDIPDFDCSANAPGSEVVEHFDAHEGRLVPLQKSQSSCLTQTTVFKDSPKCIVKQTYGRVASPSGHDTIWSYFCRSDADIQRERGVVNQVGVIGYSPSTGDTCYFNSILMGALENARSTFPSPQKVALTATLPVPIPDGFDLTNKEQHRALYKALSDLPGREEAMFIDNEIWASPKDMTGNGLDCVSCHSTYPFIRFPLVSQRRMKNFVGELPPEKATDLEFPVRKNFDSKLHRKGDSPYRIVAQKQFTKHLELLLLPTKTWTPSALVHDDLSPCTTCHRVGATEQALIHAEKVIADCAAVGNTFPCIGEAKTYHEVLSGVSLSGMKPEELKAARDIIKTCQAESKCTQYRQPLP